MNAITSILINANPAEPYLRGKATVGGVQALPIVGIAADVLVLCDDGASLAIAYVSAGAFLQLIRTGGLLPRISLLREHSPWCYLVIRDALAPDTAGRTTHDGKATGWSWSSVQGAMLSVQELGVGILSIRDESYFDEAVITLANRDRSTRRLSPPRETLWQTPAEQLLTSLPGIGPEIADTLLTICAGHVGWVLHLLTHPEGSQKGISGQKRAKIREALGLKPNECMTVHADTYLESDTDNDRNRLSDDQQALAGARP